MNADDLFEERRRFASVMKARRSDKELLELFHKLILSDKFIEWTKPYCYADLVVEAARRLGDSNLALLTQAMEERSVARKIRTGIPHEKAEAAMSALLKRVFSSTPKETAHLHQIFLWSERAGIAADRGHTICLGLNGGVPMEVMDEICDLTVHAYYPYLPRSNVKLLKCDAESHQELLAA